MTTRTVALVAATPIGLALGSVIGAVIAWGHVRLMERALEEGWGA